MPRKKVGGDDNLPESVEIENVETKNVETSVTEGSGESVVENIDADTKATEDVEVKEDKNITISSDVDKLLKLVPEYEEVYINTSGGLFTKDTKPELIKGAILYKNPYFENQN